MSSLLAFRIAVRCVDVVSMASWTSYHISQNEELQTCFNDHGFMPFMHETSRMYSPLHISKVTTKKCKYVGYKFERGSIISICPPSIHLSPDYYTHPNTYRPNRWTTSNPHNHQECGFLVPFTSTIYETRNQAFLLLWGEKAVQLFLESKMKVVQMDRGIEWNTVPECAWSSSISVSFDPANSRKNK
jgi:hypothetical protein